MENQYTAKFKEGLKRFIENGPALVFVEDSVLWYALDMGIDWYLSLSIHERINFKQSYFHHEHKH